MEIFRHGLCAIINPTTQTSHVSNGKEDCLFEIWKLDTYNYFDKNVKHISDWSNRKPSDFESLLK
jgi:hypothetical protein